jgi:hypothetical protein
VVFYLDVKQAKSKQGFEENQKEIFLLFEIFY